jgi:hypothetical protein
MRGGDGFAPGGLRTFDLITAFRSLPGVRRVPATDLVELDGSEP